MSAVDPIDQFLEWVLKNRQCQTYEAYRRQLEPPGRLYPIMLWDVLRSISISSAVENYEALSEIGEAFTNPAMIHLMVRQLTKKPAS